MNVATIVPQPSLSPSPDAGRQPPADLANLLDLSDDTPSSRGGDGAMQFWNGGSTRLYGWAAEDMATPGSYARMNTRFDTPEEDVLAELVRTGRWEGHVTRTTRDGREVLVSVRWAASRTEDSTIDRIVETGRDVTWDIILEEDFRRSEYRYRNMFQAMAVSFWELDFSAVKQMVAEWSHPNESDLAAFFASAPNAIRNSMAKTRIVDVNDKTLRMFGAKTREDLGETMERFWPRESEPVFAASGIAAMAGRPTFEAETKMLTLDGREIDVMFTWSFPPQEMGHGTVLVGIVDITGRLRVQQELQRVQGELAHAARVATLGELAASIAHEVNQPLAAIVNFGEAAKRWMFRPEPDMAEANTAIERMIADSRRASDIIGRIRGMATKSAPKPTLFHPCEAVREAVQLCRHDMQSRGVALSIAEIAGLPRVRADRIQIQQVAVNLIVNAIQAMADLPEERRALVIRTRLTPDNMVLIEVQDSGPGIDPAVADRLFTAFASTKESGMGMGLSISRSIVEAHGGKISGRANNDGPGATFAFSLPMAEGEKLDVPCPYAA